MKGEKVRALFKKNSVRVGGVVLAAVVAFGSFWALDTRNAAPELVTFVDTEGTIEIEGEEVPLAAPKVTKKVKTQKKKKKIKMKTKSTKTYVKKTKKTKKQTRTVKSGSKTTQTVTVVNTDVTDQYKKNSNINNQVTTTKTTTTTTVTQVQTKGNSGASGQASGAQQAAAPAATATPAGSYSVAQAAPVVNRTVASAFERMGFKITVNPNVSYSGLFDARSRTITMRKLDTTVYHELGHYLAFIAGNYDLTADFKGVFEREKSLYTASNKAYVLQNSSEYFAESFKNYTLEPAQLKAARPETYQAIETALAKVTESQINRIMTVYRSVWNA